MIHHQGNVINSNFIQETPWYHHRKNLHQLKWKLLQHFFLFSLALVSNVSASNKLKNENYLLKHFYSAHSEFSNSLQVNPFTFLSHYNFLLLQSHVCFYLTSELFHCHIIFYAAFSHSLAHSFQLFSVKNYFLISFSSQILLCLIFVTFFCFISGNR